MLRNSFVGGKSKNLERPSVLISYLRRHWGSFFVSEVNGDGSADQTCVHRVVSVKIQGTVRIITYSCDDTIRNKKSRRRSEACELTINDHGRRRAPSFGHDVLGHARVVGRVGQTRLLDDQVVVDGDVEVPVLRWVNYLLVLPPLHLCVCVCV